MFKKLPAKEYCLDFSDEKRECPLAYFFTMWQNAARKLFFLAAVAQW